MKRQISFLNPDISQLKVKISEDFNSVVLINGTENYILKREEGKKSALDHTEEKVDVQ